MKEIIRSLWCMQSQSSAKMTIDISSPFSPYDYLHCLTLPIYKSPVHPSDALPHLEVTHQTFTVASVKRSARTGSGWGSPARARCREYTSLIMHQEEKSIRDCIHLMHEADVYVLKCSWPPAPSLWTVWAGNVWFCGLQVALSCSLRKVTTEGTGSVRF